MTTSLSANEASLLATSTVKGLLSQAGVGWGEITSSGGRDTLSLRSGRAGRPCVTPGSTASAHRKRAGSRGGGRDRALCDLRPSPSPLWVPGPQGSDEDNNSFSHAGQASLGLADAYTSVYPPWILDSVAAVFSIRCVLGPHCGLL